MDQRASELWRHAPAILEKLDGVVGKPRDVAKGELVSVLGFDSSADESRPGVEDFEYALQTAVMSRLEAGSESKEEEVAEIVDLAAEVVAEMFERASASGASAADTDRCKIWWMMLVNVTEDTTKVVPARLLERLVGVFEASLVRLLAAAMKFATQRLKEFDQKQEAEAAKERMSKGLDDDASPDNDKEAKEKAQANLDNRKKLIAQLGISPNGHLYLTLTSLLKQVSTRLAGSFYSSLRARISLLLENLLALDHKAIANNQKLRTTDFVQIQDLDEEANATFDGGSQVLPEPTAGEETKADEKEKAKASSLGNDPVVDYELYKSFWGLQEQLQHSEKLFDKPENWEGFYKTVSKLVELFQKYPTQDNDKQPWAEQEPAPLRQAPRSRGLGVQLDDPGFRLQFLTQVMIGFQALENRPVGGPQGGMQPKSGPQSVENIKKEFQQLKKGVEACLKQTRKNYPDMLKHVLDREAHWVSWKLYGCREYQRESLEMLHGKPLPFNSMPAEPPASKLPKPKLESHVTGMLRTLKAPAWKGPERVDPSDEKAVRESMRAQILRGMCDTALERLEEEDKPENGIEDEYKAKKNKVFMWQCRRLFAQRHLRVYAQKDIYGKTDFMDFLRAAKYPNQKVAETAPSSKTAKEATAASGSPDDAAEVIAVEQSPPEGAEPAAASSETTPAAIAEPEAEPSAEPASTPAAAAAEKRPSDAPMSDSPSKKAKT